MLTLTDVQEVQLALGQILDAAGNPTTLDGEPSWASSNETILVLVDDPDVAGGKIARTVGPLGTCQVVATGDARKGPDVKELTAILDIEVIGSEGVSMGIDVGAPRDKTP